MSGATPTPSTPERWVLTGCAGFIGSHVLSKFLSLGKEVVGIDNLSGGFRSNLDAVRAEVGEKAWNRFHFYEKDIRDAAFCLEVTRGASGILHNAAVGSVPRSLLEPALFQEVNVQGTHHLLEAARKNGVERFVFASSSSVYGDSEKLPKLETEIGNPLSPYAATKRENEIDASVYARCYGIKVVGLRYFNVFGARQNPNGAYAAVIPRWITTLREGKTIQVYGDGTISRDFCFVSNVVEANVKAAHTDNPKAFGKMFNIACGDRTDLNQLARAMVDEFRKRGVTVQDKVEHLSPRAGDISHSHANVSFAKEVLGYDPAVKVSEGLSRTIDFYLSPANKAK